MKTIDYKYQLQGFNGGGLLTDTYAPNGQRIQRTYDSKKRLKQIYRISDGKRIARWKYYADWTTSELNRGNGIDTKYYRDADKNLTRLQTLNSGGTVFNLLYGYDPNNNVTYEDNTTESSWDETYGFDNANRLTAYKRGWFNGTYIPSPSSQSGWTLDDLYNWAQYIKDGVTQTRSHNLANEITQIDSASIFHDDRGNLTDDGSKLYEWNIANQLVAVREKATNNLLGQYAFDAFGRRIWKKVIATGEETDYFLTGARVIEERRHTPSTAVTYNFAWGQYIDEIVCRYTAGADHYPVQNRQYSTHRVFDGAGALVEKYRYSPHGKAEFYDPAGTPRTSSAIGMTTLFTGRELDPESGLYYFRARMWSPQAGRFMQRDPIGYQAGLNLYNGYFVPGGMDPSGKECYYCCEIDPKSIATPGNTDRGVIAANPLSRIHRLPADQQIYLIRASVKTKFKIDKTKPIEPCNIIQSEQANYNFNAVTQLNGRDNTQPIEVSQAYVEGPGSGGVGQSQSQFTTVGVSSSTGNTPGDINTYGDEPDRDYGEGGKLIIEFIFLSGCPDGPSARRVIQIEWNNGPQPTMLSSTVLPISD